MLGLVCAGGEMTADGDRQARGQVQIRYVKDMLGGAGMDLWLGTQKEGVLFAFPDRFRIEEGGGLGTDRDLPRLSDPLHDRDGGRRRTADHEFAVEVAHQEELERPGVDAHG